MNRRSWKEADNVMLNTNKVVNMKNASISATAKEYGVPRMTLSGRVKGKVPMDTKMGRPPVLGDDHVIGPLPCDREMKCFNRSTEPSLTWWRGFMDIHHELSLRKPESVDHERVTNAKPDIIGNYFDVLHATLEEQHLSLK